MNKRSFTAMLGLMLFLLAGARDIPAQTDRTPLLQDIAVAKKPQAALPTPTPLVKKTGSSVPTASKGLSMSLKTSLPALSEIEIPAFSGLLVESEGGRVILENYPDKAFNPASNVKIATAFAVLRSFGPGYRFLTDFWTDGSVDLETATLSGNLYVSGRDPVFNLEHAMAVANELNRMGIRKIDGDVIVVRGFMMGLRRSSRRSASLLTATMDGGKRTAAANTAWDRYLTNAGRYKPGSIVPSVTVTGETSLGELPRKARLMFTHDSAPLREIVKATLSYSNNFLAARLGEMVGGPKAVARIVRSETRSGPGEFSLETTSGLGINRVTPRTQIRLLRAMKKMLRQYRMTLSDVLPVAGVDEGTLRKRFGSGAGRGSVIGKTGTLRRTDGGVSSLSGEITTRKGKFLFVIFNQEGRVNAFRNFQNMFVPLLQDELGGAIPAGYAPITMERRLATSRIRRPRMARYGRD